MLQFITCKNDKYSLPEEAQMVIEGGCRWVQFTPSGLPEEEARNSATQIMELCRENDTFLIIENDLPLTKELGAYGIHISDYKLNPGEVREQLGAEPIIGVTVKTAGDVASLRGVDIDYATFVLPDGNVSSEVQNTLIKNLSDILGYIKEKGLQLPIVVRGEVSKSDMEMLVGLGVSGFALSCQIIDEADPVTYTSEIVDFLNNLRK